MKSWLFILTLLLLLLGLVVYFITSRTIPPPSQTESGELFVEALANKTILSRTESGIPEIEAQSMDDAFFALGFAHARDQLWQMQLVKWALSSEISSVFGDEFKDVDELMVMISSHFDEAEVQKNSTINAYVDGINAFIKESGQRYPVQFTLTNTIPKLWTQADALKYIHVFQWFMMNGWQTELASGITNAYLPESLLPFVTEDSNRFILDRYHHDAALKLLESDQKLRTFLNFPSGLSSVQIAHSTFDSTLVFAHQSGVSRGSLWMPVRIKFGRKIISGTTTPGLPFFVSGTNGQSPWLIQSQGIQMSTFINNLQSDTIPNRMILTDGQKSEHVFNYFALSGTSGSPDWGDFLFKVPKVISAKEIVRLISIPFETSDNPDNPDNSDNGVTQYLFNDGTIQSNFVSISDFSSHLNFITFDQPLSSNPFNLPESLNTDVQAAVYAHMLSDLVTEFSGNQAIDLARSYLSNWDGQYASSSVAASLFEGTMHFITRSTLGSYLPENVFDRLIHLDAVYHLYATQLLTQAYRATNHPELFSPVSTAYLARRLTETIEYFRHHLGDSNVEWRWGSINAYSHTEWLLCRSEDVLYFPGNKVCNQLLGHEAVSLFGGKRTFLAVKTNFSDAPTVRSITSTYSLFRSDDQAAQHVFIYPGVSGNPVSPYYFNLPTLIQPRDMQNLVPFENPSSTLYLLPKP